MVGGAAATGTISAAGLYTAPQSLPSPATVTVSATSAADPSKSASATVTVQSDVSVSVTPAPAAVELGAAQQFTVAVTGSGNPTPAVMWTVNGIAGGNSTVGTISATGLYTAPPILPAPATVSVAATSLADPAKSATAMTSVTSNLSVAVSGPAAVNTGAAAQFTALVMPVPGSNPDRGVTWSVNGISGGNATVGTIDTSGLYTAPRVAPATPTVTITAGSVADPAKSGAVAVTINVFISISISPSPSVSVPLEGTQGFTATVTGVLNQNVTWFVNGIVGGDQNTVGAISNPGATPATYFAPLNLPPAGTAITVSATSQADPTKSASVIVTLFSNIFIGVSTLNGGSASVRAVGRRETICAALAGTSNPAVEWRVEGVVNGNASVGQIAPSAALPAQCALGAPPGGDIIIVDYVAPTAVPPSNPVTLRVTSMADPGKLAELPVTVVPAVTVGVTPATASVVPGGSEPFAATVTGTPDVSVTWSVAGSGCGGMACGAISASGLYTAMPTATLLATDTVTATASDGGATGSASVTIAATVTTISRLVPASASAGASTPFPLRVLGANFPAGAEILFNGVARATSCPTANECTATVLPADVAAVGSVMIQVRDAGPPLGLSNQVMLAVVALVAAEEVIALDAGAPDAAGKDIVVVDVAAPAGALNNLILLGTVVGSTCATHNGPVLVTRPASGATTVDICVGNADASQTFKLSGPASPDITIVGVRPLNLGFVQVQVTLSVPSTAAPGLRTLFAVDGNSNKTAAAGAIRVK